jgi:mycothiol system anti-sigma-R factor
MKLNCKDAVKYLHQFLDKELLPDEIDIVQEHLDRCTNCRKRFSFQGEIKRLVRRSATQEAAPPNLKQRLSSLRPPPISS